MQSRQALSPVLQPGCQSPFSGILLRIGGMLLHNAGSVPSETARTLRHKHHIFPHKRCKPGLRTRCRAPCNLPPADTFAHNRDRAEYTSLFSEHPVRPNRRLRSDRTPWRRNSIHLCKTETVRVPSEFPFQKDSDSWEARIPFATMGLKNILHPSEKKRPAIPCCSVRAHPSSVGNRRY